MLEYLLSFMTVCYDCGQPASQSVTFSYNGGNTRTFYYCKKHTPQTQTNGITIEQMKKLDPEFTKRFD